MKVGLSHLALALTAAFAALLVIKTVDRPSGAATAGPNCTASDFQIRDLTAHRNYERATLNGSIVSHCRQAAVVRMLWTEHNPDGTTSAFPFLAHDGAPIGPNESYLFTTSAQVQTGPNARYTVAVDGVQAAN